MKALFKLSLITLSCCCLLLILTWKTNVSQPSNKIELADIFQLDRPIQDFEGSLILDPRSGCDQGCDVRTEKTKRLEVEKSAIKNKHEKLIKSLKSERDALQEKVFRQAIGFHQDQLVRAVASAKAMQQNRADVYAQFSSQKLEDIEKQLERDLQLEHEHERREKELQALIPSFSVNDESIVHSASPPSSPDAAAAAATSSSDSRGGPTTERDDDSVASRWVRGSDPRAPAVVSSPNIFVNVKMPAAPRPTPPRPARGVWLPYPQNP